MQIHELNTYTGTPGAGDWLAIDNGEETTKMTVDSIIDSSIDSTYTSAGWSKGTLNKLSSMLRFIGRIFNGEQKILKALTFAKNSSNADSAGIYLTDQENVSYPGVRDNGTNLWIGALATAARHHRGQTYISAGYNGTTGNKSIKISVPNENNDNGSNYDALHTGYTPDNPSISITNSTGTRYETKVNRYGKVVQLKLRIQKSSETPAGSNLYQGTIETTGLRPADIATGVGYYGQQVFSGQISTAGNITIRNASSTAQPAISGTNAVNISFTYLTN